MNYNFTDFLTRLQQVKTNKKLRVEDISKLSGVPVGTLSKILAGITTDPKINTVISIAEALDISPDYLIYGKNNSYEISDGEYELVKKYRQLDADGKERIANMVDMEYSQVQRKDGSQSEEKAM